MCERTSAVCKPLQCYRQCADSCGQENTGALKKKKKCNHVPHGLFFMMSVQPNHRTLSPFNTI